MSQQNDTNVFNTICLYGATKTGKTREIGAMALYVWEKYKKKTRLISADGGGWGSIQDYVDAGLVDAINIADHPSPLTALKMFGRGDWVHNDKWVPRAKDASFAEIGMYAIEGFASIASLIMRDTVENGRKISEELAAKFVVEAENEKFTFGAPGRAHYGFVQNTILATISEFQGLIPKGVRLVLFTSLESAGEDEITGRKILGPASAGKAITQIITQKVGDLIHMTVANVERDKKQVEEYRAYFKNHLDPELNKNWPASLRLGPIDPKLTTDDAVLSKKFIALTDETGVTRHGVSRLFRRRDELGAEGVKALKAFMQGGDGYASGGEK